MKMNQALVPYHLSGMPRKKMKVFILNPLYGDSLFVRLAWLAGGELLPAVKARTAHRCG
jgi:hypothetical protein